MNDFPHADDVGGDLLAAAKSLVSLGWARASVVVARAALESVVADMVRELGFEDDLPDRNFMRESLERLEAKGVISRRFRKDLVGVYSDASAVAHGERVSLHRAVQLIVLADEFRRGLFEAFRTGSMATYRPSPATVARRGVAHPRPRRRRIVKGGEPCSAPNA
ncbi:hypothetical protein Pla123a_30270 [Posidoniimonas polymericola]|uniref:DUF4145 domain-containing protein n=1 Tax=Posidoniimonas polymericola TaxID=2528002 RepID=A0A5C5YL37_9BACT|nr:hypothetical protein [Posidoniimonas polymericola]TWT75518.1 hypothetical protein Pla123a_30270 [Posidoniimonas polymericola]